MQGTREYNVGEAPEASVLQELQRRQLNPPPGFAAQRMDPAQDIVQFDLLLVMDKFTAADVLREVSHGPATARSSWSQSSAQRTAHCGRLAAACLNPKRNRALTAGSHGLQVSVYETINRAQQYSKKVRRLGEFHPQLAQSKAQDGQDIDDPLYGNMGGPDEQVRAAGPARCIAASKGCEVVMNRRVHAFEGRLHDCLVSYLTLCLLLPANNAALSAIKCGEGLDG